MAESCRPEHTAPAVTHGSDEDIQLFCQPCDKDGPRLPAYGYCINCKEHLCEDCFKIHKKVSLCKNHRLLHQDSMPLTQQVSEASQHEVLPDNLSQLCRKHQQEVIKLYCNDHKALLCTLCYTLQHKACTAEYIPDLSSKTIDSKEFHNALKTIGDIINKCQTLTTGWKEMTTKSNSSLSNALKNMKIYRTKLNERLDELEKEAEETVTSLQLENDDKLNKTETMCEDVMTSLTRSSDKLKELNSWKQEDKLFIELKLAEDLIKEYGDRISKYEMIGKITEYIFKPNQAISAFLETEKSFGTLENQPNCQSQTVKPRSVSELNKIWANTEQDRYQCNISGLAVLSPDRITITDANNYSVKMIDVEIHSIISELFFDSKTWDICSVGRNELAVTQPEEHMIQFISASNDKLKQKRSLEVDGKCHGVSCYEDKLVVTFVEPGEVRILNMNGDVLNVMKTDPNNEDIFSEPHYNVTNGSSIYVSDLARHSVYKLNWQGEVIASFKTTDPPRGLALSDVGSVFVCNAYKESILEVAGDCSEAAVVLENVEPFAVCWCSARQAIYISSWSTKSSSKRRNVHMIKLS